MLKLFRLVHGDSTLGVLCRLFGFGFFHSQGFVNPMVGGLQIFRAAGKIVAFNVALFAVHEVQVSHRIVIVGTELDGLVEAVDALLDGGCVLCLQLFADLLLVFVLGIQILFRLHAQCGAFFHAGLVGGGPVDDADRIIGLGIVRVQV